MKFTIAVLTAFVASSAMEQTCEDEAEKALREKRFQEQGQRQRFDPMFFCMQMAQCRMSADDFPNAREGDVDVFLDFSHQHVTFSVSPVRNKVYSRQFKGKNFQQIAEIENRNTTHAYEEQALRRHSKTANDNIHNDRNTEGKSPLVGEDLGWYFDLLVIQKMKAQIGMKSLIEIDDESEKVLCNKSMTLLPECPKKTVTMRSGTGQTMTMNLTDICTESCTAPAKVEVHDGNGNVQYVDVKNDSCSGGMGTAPIFISIVVILILLAIGGFFLWKKTQAKELKKMEPDAGVLQQHLLS